MIGTDTLPSDDVATPRGDVHRTFADAVEPYDPRPLQIIPAPGHCPDHHVVWDAARGILYSADLWLGVHARVMHLEEDPRRLVRDLRAAAALAPERMFDAHRGPVRDPVRALNAKADWLDETIAVVERRVRDGWSDRVILRDPGAQTVLAVTFGRAVVPDFT